MTKQRIVESVEERLMRTLSRIPISEMYALMTGDIFAEATDEWWKEKRWTQQEYFNAVCVMKGHEVASQRNNMDDLEKLYRKLKQVPFNNITYLKQSRMTDPASRYQDRVDNLLSQGWTVDDFMKTATTHSNLSPICILYMLMFRHSNITVLS